MTTEAQKRAHDKLAEARRAAGKRPKTVWLTEAGRTKLASLAKVHGSEEKALEHVLERAMSVMPIQPAEQSTERRPPAPNLGGVKRPVPVSRGKLDTVTERVSFGPVDALTGKPLERRRAIPKGEKR